MNPLDYVGIGGAPIIERTVQVIREQFKLSSWVAPYLVLLLSTIEQFGLSYILHYSVEQFFINLTATAFAVWGVHEVSK